MGPTLHPLENAFWHSMTGAQARYAVGSGAARRYVRGFSPIAGFAAPNDPDLDALKPYCEPSEQFYCSGWSGPVPRGWRVDSESTMLCMVWDGRAVPAENEAGIDVLGPNDATAAVELATLTRPGPFGPRTLELGTYLGIRAGDRLAAMAGERTHVGEFREVSGVCTHPNAQGRGLARRLLHLVIARQRAKAQVPFLHVMRDNLVAHDFYLRMGFVDRHEVAVRVVSWS